MAQAQPQSAPGRPRRFGLHFQVVNRIVGQIGRLTAFVVLGLFATTSRSAAQGIEVTVFTGLAYPLYDERLTLRAGNPSIPGVEVVDAPLLPQLGFDLRFGTTNGPPLLDDLLAEADPVRFEPIFVNAQVGLAIKF